MEKERKWAAERAAVMLGFAEGKQIQFSVKPTDSWTDTQFPAWNWAHYDYRIKPEPREFWIVYDKPDGFVRSVYETEKEGLYHLEDAELDHIEQELIHVKEVIEP